VTRPLKRNWKTIQVKLKRKKLSRHSKRIELSLLELSKEKGGFMLSGPEVLVIQAIALFVFGPRNLPGLAKSLGKE